jgi:hypothetical protein
MHTNAIAARLSATIADEMGILRTKMAMVPHMAMLAMTLRLSFVVVPPQRDSSLWKTISQYVSALQGEKNNPAGYGSA